MSVVLLDTTVASLLHPRKKRDAQRARYEQHMLGQTLALSFQSVAELWGWAESRRWGERERRGRRFEAGDCWIVATAVHRKIPLLTNDRDMTGYAISDLEVVSYVDDDAPHNA